MRNRLLVSAFVCLLATTSIFALSSTAVQGKINLLLKGWVVRSGETVALDKEAVKPGDTITWSITSANETESAVTNFVATGLIPSGTTYIAGSASAQASLEFSLDSGKTWAARPLIRERDANGVERLVEAPPSRYTDLRFTYPQLPPGSQTANYQVRVK